MGEDTVDRPMLQLRDKNIIIAIAIEQRGVSVYLSAAQNRKQRKMFQNPIYF